jgi:hypothetical protein
MDDSAPLQQFSDQDEPVASAKNPAEGKVSEVQASQSA